MNYANTYWNNNGKYHFARKELHKLIETVLREQVSKGNGQTLPKDTHKALDKFRRASYCSYDLYNNGLFNESAEFRKVFGFSARSHGYSWRKNDLPDSLVNATEAKFNELLVKACLEQNIDIR